MIKYRDLRTEEAELFSFLLKNSTREVNYAAPSKAKAIDCQDGGMGSISFYYPDFQKTAPLLVACEASYTDADGVLVSIALMVDKSGNPWEMDFWKVDFSPLITYPRAPDLIVNASR